jgi:hypothetical protein
MAKAKRGILKNSFRHSKNLERTKCSLNSLPKPKRIRSFEGCLASFLIHHSKITDHTILMQITGIFPETILIYHKIIRHPTFDSKVEKNRLFMTGPSKISGFTTLG